jgi:hypothetical protein
LGTAHAAPKAAKKGQRKDGFLARRNWHAGAAGVAAIDYIVIGGEQISGKSGR